MDQLRIFEASQYDKKLSKRFKILIKKYHHYCKIYGYCSKEPGTLIKFLHSKGYRTGKDLIRTDSKYILIYRGNEYDLESLILIFKNDKGNDYE